VIFLDDDALALHHWVAWDDQKMMPVSSHSSVFVAIQLDACHAGVVGAFAQKRNPLLRRSYLCDMFAESLVCSPEKLFVLDHSLLARSLHAGARFPSQVI
jgi:hypothetical protein